MDRDRILKINSFATRCFRNMADQDYIAARLSYRNKLIVQFQTSSHMALEKYLKAILLYNRVKARRVGHDLRKARRKLREIAIIDIELSDETERFIEHIDDVGNNRYLEKSYFTRGPAIARLDRAVWEIRRYCRILDPQLTAEPEQESERLRSLREELMAADPYKPERITIDGGTLEEILVQSSHPARKALIWSNLFFYSRKRKTVQVPGPWVMENSPYFLYPEILDEVSRYVHIPAKLLETHKPQLHSSEV